MLSLRELRAADPVGFIRLQFFEDFRTQYESWYKYDFDRKDRINNVAACMTISLMATVAILIQRPLFSQFKGNLSDLRNRIINLKSNLESNDINEVRKIDEKIVAELDKLQNAIRTAPPQKDTKVLVLDQQFLAKFNFVIPEQLKQPVASASSVGTSKATATSQDPSPAIKILIEMLSTKESPLKNQVLKAHAVGFAEKSLNLSLSLVQFIDDVELREEVLEDLRETLYPDSLDAFDDLYDGLLEQFTLVRDAVRSFPQPKDQEAAFQWLNDVLDAPIPADFPNQPNLWGCLDEEMFFNLQAILAKPGSEGDDSEAMQNDLAASTIAVQFLEKDNYSDFVEILGTISSQDIRVQTSQNLFKHLWDKAIVKRQYDHLFTIVKLINPVERADLVGRIALLVAEDFPEFAKDLLKIYPDFRGDKLNAIVELEKMTTFKSVQIRFKSMLHTWYALNNSAECFIERVQQRCHNKLNNLKGGKFFK